jgi:hypothetical protein
VVIDPLHADYVKRASAAGLPGAAIVDAKRESVQRHAPAFPPLEVPAK